MNFISTVKQVKHTALGYLCLLQRSTCRTHTHVYTGTCTYYSISTTYREGFWPLLYDKALYDMGQDVRLYNGFLFLYH